MEWYQILSFFLTNGLRLIVGLVFVAKLTDLPLGRKTPLLSAAGECFITFLQAVALPDTVVLAAEILLVLAIFERFRREQLHRCLFLAFFYEIGVGLWDFLFSAGLSVLFHSARFLEPRAPEYLAGIWLMRLFMTGSVILVMCQRRDAPAKTFRLVSMIAVLGFFCAVTLSEQTVFPLDDGLVGKWVILAVILLLSILFYRVTRQREMELEIARLKTEQAELLERDYQNLNRVYSANATLYHDLQNHLEALYSYISGGQTELALGYIKDLRTPFEKIVRGMWTGDEAVDYLIGSKMSAADSSGIKTKINIEFPRHTKIKSADLSAVLGNLLDNGLEAAEKMHEEPRFLYLTIRRIHNMLIIKVENSCTLKPFASGTELKTTKDNGALHGWGLKSARAAAERYDGTLELTCENGVFCAVATLCFEAIS